MDFWRHLKTVQRHRHLVRQYCFRLGLYWQGLTHDLSKFSPVEFWAGVKYFQGDRSPNAAEKEIMGYSPAWLHHKGRNKHHFEYWTDVSTREDNWRIVGVKMPVQYFVEMVMDRIAASRTYRGRAYTDGDPYAYFSRSKDVLTMHPETKRELDKVLRMLEKKGEPYTFRYLRYLLKKGDY